MKASRLFVQILLPSAIVLRATFCAAAPQVEFVILGDQNLANATAGRKWIDLLSGLGVGDVQMRIRAVGGQIGNRNPRHQGVADLPRDRQAGQRQARRSRRSIRSRRSPANRQMDRRVGEQRGGGGDAEKIGLRLARPTIGRRPRRSGPAGRICDQRHGAGRSDREDPRPIEIQARDRREHREGHCGRRPGAQTS